MALPRQFVPHADQTPPARAEQPILRHAVDVLVIGGGHLVETESLVATEAAGNLHVLPSAGAPLSASMRRQIAHREASNTARPRTLDVVELFLFDLQVMEQPMQAPGINDPIYLYGTLHGPFPDGERGPIKGQLTVTRADLLAGLVHGAAHAMALPDGGRCFSALLPCDREEEIQQGRGVVLAYPLMPAELLLEDPANDLLVAQLIHDVLGGLQEDLREGGVKHPLVEMTLPVPSRAALEQELISQGYTVEGETAVRRRGGGTGLTGLLMSAFGSLGADKLVIPPEADVDELLRLAKQTLDALPGWPNARAAVLRSRLRGHGVTSPRVPPPPRAAPAFPSPPPRPRPQLSAPATAGPASWMTDFMAQHHASGRRPARVTSVQTVAPPRVKGPEPPASHPVNQDWMNDFGSGGQKTPRAATTSKPEAPTEKPDWMKDFDQPQPCEVNTHVARSRKTR